MPTVKEAPERFLEGCVASGLPDSTIKKQKNVLEKRLADVVGDARLPAAQEPGRGQPFLTGRESSNLGRRTTLPKMNESLLDRALHVDVGFCLQSGA